MENDRFEAIFKKHFQDGMVNKNFASFKKTHPTLYRVILTSLNEASELKTPLLLPPSEAFMYLENAVNSFSELNYRAGQLYIYCPEWYKAILIHEASKEIFIDRLEPFTFMGVEFLPGYENAIIVTNSRERDIKILSQITQRRIELI